MTQPTPEQPDIERLKGLTSFITREKAPHQAAINSLYRENDGKGILASWEAVSNTITTPTSTFAFCQAETIATAMAPLLAQNEQPATLFKRTSAILLDLSDRKGLPAVGITFHEFNLKDTTHSLTIQRAGVTSLPPQDGVLWNQFNTWDGALVTSLNSQGIEPALVRPTIPKALSGRFSFNIEPERVGQPKGEDLVSYTAPIGVVLPVDQFFATLSLRGQGYSPDTTWTPQSPICASRAILLTPYPVQWVDIAPTSTLVSPRATVRADSVKRI